MIMATAADTIRRNIATVKQAQPLSCFIMTPLHFFTTTPYEEFCKQFATSLRAFAAKRSVYLAKIVENYRRRCANHSTATLDDKIRLELARLTLDCYAKKLKFLTDEFPTRIVAFSDVVDGEYCAKSDSAPEPNFGVYPFASFYDYVIERKIEQNLPEYVSMAAKDKKYGHEEVYGDLLDKVERGDLDRQWFLSDLQLTESDIRDFLEFEEMPNNGHMIVLDPLDAHVNLQTDVRAIVTNMYYIAFAKAFRIRVIVPRKIDMTNCDSMYYISKTTGPVVVAKDEKLPKQPRKWNILQEKIGWAIGRYTDYSACREDTYAEEPDCIFDCLARAFYICAESTLSAPDNHELAELLYVPPDGLLYQRALQKYTDSHVGSSRNNSTKYRDG